MASRFFEVYEQLWKEDRILKEGISESYPYGRVIQYLATEYKDLILKIDSTQYLTNKRDYTSDNPLERHNTRGISVYFKKDKVDNHLSKILNEGLGFYGYFVSNIKNIILNKIEVVGVFIEPKFTFVIDHKYLKGLNFYHITYSIYLHKILKYGLTPKDSKTIFKHDGNRIYIMAAKTAKDCIPLALTLTKFKNLNPSQIRILKLDTSDLTLYLDPNCDDLSDPFTAVYTFGNIPPYKITVLK